MYIYIYNLQLNLQKDKLYSSLLYLLGHMQSPQTNLAQCRTKTKPVPRQVCRLQASSVYKHYGTVHSSKVGPQFAVDGIKSNSRSDFGFYHSDLENFPWIAVIIILVNVILQF